MLEGLGVGGWATVIACLFQILDWSGITPAAIIQRFGEKKRGSMKVAMTVQPRSKVLLFLIAASWLWCGVTFYRLHVYHLESRRNAIFAWGMHDEELYLGVNTQYIEEFATPSYTAILVAQPVNLQVDVTRDTAIVKSKAFSIPPSTQMAIGAAPGPLTMEALQRPNGVPIIMSLCVLPNKIDPSKIASLSDVGSFGGTVVTSKEFIMHAHVASGQPLEVPH